MEEDPYKLKGTLKANGAKIKGKIALVKLEELETGTIKDNDLEISTKRILLDRAKINKMQIVTPTPPLDLRNIQVQQWSFEKDEKKKGEIFFMAEYQML